MVPSRIRHLKAVTGRAVCCRAGINSHVYIKVQMTQNVLLYHPSREWCSGAPDAFVGNCRKGCGLQPRRRGPGCLPIWWFSHLPIAAGWPLKVLALDRAPHWSKFLSMWLGDTDLRSWVFSWCCCFGKKPALAIGFLDWDAQSRPTYGSILAGGEGLASRPLLPR